MEMTTHEAVADRLAGPRKSPEQKLGEARLDAADLQNNFAARRATIKELQRSIAALAEQADADSEAVARIVGEWVSDA
jgi:hypothetical protein